MQHSMFPTIAQQERMKRAAEQVQEENQVELKEAQEENRSKQRKVEQVEPGVVAWCCSLVEQVELERRERRMLEHERELTQRWKAQELKHDGTLTKFGRMLEQELVQLSKESEASLRRELKVQDRVKNPNFLQNPMLQQELKSLEKQTETLRRRRDDVKVQLEKVRLQLEKKRFNAPLVSGATIIL